jgi:anti-sigma B factor antagonist
MDKATVLEISGDIDMAHSTELRRVVLVEFRESRTPKVVLNMLGVRYIDSSGVASLVEGLKASRDVGSRMILVSLSPFVQEILRLTRLLQIFEIYDSEEKALAS